MCTNDAGRVLQLIGVNLRSVNENSRKNANETESKSLCQCRQSLGGLSSAVSGVQWDVERKNW